MVDESIESEIRRDVLAGLPSHEELSGIEGHFTNKEKERAARYLEGMSENERAVLLLELAKLSERDPLTEVLNRRGLISRAQGDLDHSRRQNEKFVVFAVDVDNFKADINDAYGHAVGDAVLCHIAHSIRESIRVTDEVARTGGDEFSGYLVNPDVEVFEDIRMRINSRLNDPEKLAKELAAQELELTHDQLENLSQKVNISLGTASPQNKEEPFLVIMKRAGDEAARVKTEKKAGR